MYAHIKYLYFQETGLEISWVWCFVCACGYVGLSGLG